MIYAFFKYCKIASKPLFSSPGTQTRVQVSKHNILIKVTHHSSFFNAARDSSSPSV